MEEGKLDKSDTSPVTIADFGVQAIVLKHLSAHFPLDKVCAEENADGLRRELEVLELVVDGVRAAEPSADAEQVCDWIDRGLLRDTARERRFWTLDPIDGTKGFLRRQQYALCLALIVDGEPVVAAQACPNLPVGEDYLGKVGVSSQQELGQLSSTCPGALFCAVKGRGAWEQALPAPGSKLRSLLEDQKKEDLRVELCLPGFDESRQGGMRFCESYESGHSSHEDAALVAKELGITRPPLRMDSQVKYGILSRNEAQVFLRLPGGLTGGTYRENIWDHASGTLLLTEAGGDVCDIFGKPLDFSQGYKLFENKGVVAASSRELLLKVVGAAAAVRGQQ